MKPQGYFFRFFPIFLEFSIKRQVGMERNNNFYFLPFWAVINVFLLQMKLKWNSSNFLNFFAICLEFSITHWVGTKWNVNFYFFLFLVLFQWIFAWKDAITVFLEFLGFLCNFFMNFLWRLGLERNGKIMFIFPVSRSIPTYYGFKWIHNGIFKFSEFFFYFFWIFYYASGRNETER